MDFGCRWSSGNNHSLRGRVRCVVLIASYREARVRGLALKTEAFEADMGSKDLGLVTFYSNRLYFAGSRLRFAASRL